MTTNLWKPVLILDSDEDSREVLSNLLELTGLTTIPIGDLEQLKVVLATSSVDTAVLDLDSPGIDWLEAASIIRAKLPPNKFNLIALTAWGPDQLDDLVAKAGFNHYLVKPFSLQHLGAAIGVLENRLLPTM